MHDTPYLGSARTMLVTAVMAGLVACSPDRYQGSNASVAVDPVSFTQDQSQAQDRRERAQGPTSLSEAIFELYQQNPRMQRLAQRCEDFDYPSFAPQSPLEGSLLVPATLQVWAEPVADGITRINLSGRNEPLRLARFLGTPAEWVDQEANANFRLYFNRALDEVSQAHNDALLYKNDGCVIWFAEGVNAAFAPENESKADANRDRATCFGNGFLAALGVRPFLQGRDAYPVLTIGDAPSGIVVEYNQNLIGVRGEERVRCLTLGQRERQSFNTDYEEYLRELEGFRSLTQSAP